MQLAEENTSAKCALTHNVVTIRSKPIRREAMSANSDHSRVSPKATALSSMLAPSASRPRGKADTAETAEGVTISNDVEARHATRPQSHNAATVSKQPVGHGTTTTTATAASRLQRPGFSSINNFSDAKAKAARPAQSSPGRTVKATPSITSTKSLRATVTPGKALPAQSNGSNIASTRTITTPKTAPARPARAKALKIPSTPTKASLSSSTPRSTKHTTLRQPPLTLRPESSTSSRGPASSPLKALSAKPAFNTYQRSFSPTKQSQAGPPPIASSVSTANVRAETHLLHLSLLHQSAAPTLKAWTSSAHDQLLSSHQSLQMLYAHVMQLEQEARQAGNMVVLHQWAGGNMRSVGRRLNVLCSVLKEVTTLTAPGGRNTPVSTKIESRKNVEDGKDEQEEGEVDGGFFWKHEAEPIEEQQGEYARLIDAFTSWTNWVQEIWRVRDKEIFDEVYDPIPAGAIQPQASANAITPIDPLGDSLKSSLRTLTHTISSLQLRLDELPDFPQSAQNLETTPVHVLKLAREIIASMKEELQLIREIEFEVVVGEEAWLKQRLSSLSGEVERGFATPLRR